MNLVIDDAVEVQLATRDSPEKRRQLGKGEMRSVRRDAWLIGFRTNSTQGRQCFPDSIPELNAANGSSIIFAVHPATILSTRETCRDCNLLFMGTMMWKMEEAPSPAINSRLRRPHRLASHAQ